MWELKNLRATSNKLTHADCRALPSHSWKQCPVCTPAPPPAIKLMTARKMPGFSGSQLARACGENSPDRLAQPVLFKPDIFADRTGKTDDNMSQVKTILYVEDDLVVLTAHQKCLEHAGYHVIPARDGLEAMKRLSMFVPDLMLLDLVMPRFKGEDVLEFIRTKPACLNCLQKILKQRMNFLY